jgi:hypothetical protein
MKLYRCQVEDQRDPNLRCYSVTLDSDKEAEVHFKRIFGDRLKRIFYASPSDTEPYVTTYERR